MTLELYLPFLAATIILMLIPGPNVALITANSVAHGTRYGLMTVIGTSAAGIIQLAIAAVGMTSVLTVLSEWFEWLRWIGVAYLVWLGVTTWRAAPVDLTKIPPQARSVRTILTRGFLVSMTNPKTLLFYGAFLPQFISPAAPVAPQLALLCATILVTAALVDSGWAVLAGRARGLLAARGRLRNRLTGGLLILAGAGLAAARKT
jgi:homoserine/homoserine lactone efflux protein